jgi:hypothetical protein
VHAKLGKTLLRDLVIWLGCGLIPTLRIGEYLSTGLLEGTIHWLLLLSIAFVPVMVFHIIAAAYKPTPPRPGFCRMCGYNLTGNVSGICPECGIAPSKLGRGG